MPNDIPVVPSGIDSSSSSHIEAGEEGNRRNVRWYQPDELIAFLCLGVSRITDTKGMKPYYDTESETLLSNKSNWESITVICCINHQMVT